MAPEDHLQRTDDEAGFSLVELLVVVLVVGILVAIAVPTFLGAQGSAKTKAASSNLRVALSSAKTMHTEEQTYLVSDAPTTVTKLHDAEPTLTWQQAPATAPEQISVVSDNDTAGFATRSKDGHCLYVVDDVGPAGGIAYGRSVAAEDDCAASLDTAPSPGVAWAGTPGGAGW